MTDDLPPAHQRQLNLYQHGVVNPEADSPPAEDELLDRLEDQSVSSKFLYWALENTDAKAVRELSTETATPERTVAYNIAELQEDELVEETPYMGDARITAYTPSLQGVYPDIVDSRNATDNWSDDEDVEGLTPSGRFLHRMLFEYGPQTEQELQDYTLLPERTMRHSLKRLQDENAITTIDETVPQKYMVDR